MNFWFNLLVSTLSDLPYGKINIKLPNNKIFKFKGFKNGPSVNLEILQDSSLKKIMTEGSVGFAEDFIENKIRTSNLSELMYYFALNNEHIEEKFRYNFIFKLTNFYKHFLRKNSKYKAKKNIKFHYDLGNDFYKNWLDKSMTYSSAIFNKKNIGLYSAQKNKYKKISQLSKIGNKDRVLEIGCGWGGFMEYILNNSNCKITGTTISDAQYEYASQRLNGLRLRKNAQLIKKDYRDLTGKFDKIVSIEMFEAVGKDYWDIYFKKIRQLINDNGIILLQLITIKDESYKYYSKNPDFIQKYIFPGGMLISLEILKKIINENHLTIESITSYSDDYAQTLNLWQKKFNEKRKQIKEIGFDEKFIRLWNYYLSYCESGFKSKNINLNHIKIIPN